MHWMKRLMIALVAVRDQWLRIGDYPARRRGVPRAEGPQADPIRTLSERRR